jgi:hypothetical protein
MVWAKIGKMRGVKDQLQSTNYEVQSAKYKLRSTVAAQLIAVNRCAMIGLNCARPTPTILIVGLNQ